MTTVLAVQGDGWAVLGADSRIVDGTRSYEMARGFTKLVKNGKYILGAAGDLRAINIIHHSFDPPSAKSLVGAELDKFMTSEFLPALRECFEDEGYGETTRRSDNATAYKQAPAQHESELLVAVNGVIYEIGGDYSWTREQRSIYAVGSGSSYALGAAYASATMTKPDDVDTAKALVRESLTIAARLDIFTSAPFTIYAQQSPEKK